MVGKYKFQERVRIHRQAKRLVGIKSDAGDRFTFMQQCIGELMDEGSDPEEARSICELLWDEGEDLWD